MNVGFLEAQKLYDYDCFIFHDVDLIPEDDRNLYSCPQSPRHMSVAIDRMNYKYVDTCKCQIDQAALPKHLSNIWKILEPLEQVQDDLSACSPIT